MTTPNNLPNQVGVQGIQAQMALWISRAANAVNALLGWATSPNVEYFTNGGSLGAISTTGSLLYTGASVALTPNKSGKVLLTASINPYPGPTGTLALCYSTSPPPAFGAAQTGTIVGGQFNYDSTTITTFNQQMSLGPVVLSLTLGTTYYFMIGVNVGSGSCDCYYPNLVAAEL